MKRPAAVDKAMRILEKKGATDIVLEGAYAFGQWKMETVEQIAPVLMDILLEANVRNARSTAYAVLWWNARAKGWL